MKSNAIFLMCFDAFIKVKSNENYLAFDSMNFQIKTYRHMKELNLTICQKISKQDDYHHQFEIQDYSENRLDSVSLAVYVH